MRTLLGIIVPPLFLLGCALLMIWLPLPLPFPPALSSGRNLAAAAVTGLLGLVYLAGLAVHLVTWFRGAARELDWVFLPRGLESASHMGVGRAYRGWVDGREVGIDYLPSRGVQLALLNIRISADVGARAAVGARRPILDSRECARVEVGVPGAADLHVVAEDEGWVRGFREWGAVGRLLADHSTVCGSSTFSRRGSGCEHVPLDGSRISGLSRGLTN